MKKSKSFIITVLIILVLIISYLSITNWLFFSMKRLPQGDYITQSKSPNNEYIVKLYLCNGGATVDYSVRGELIINGKNNKHKNIYWDYKTSESNIEWIDGHTVSINGHTIHCPNGEYDFRKQE